MTTATKMTKTQIKSLKLRITALRAELARKARSISRPGLGNGGFRPGYFVAASLASAASRSRATWMEATSRIPAFGLARHSRICPYALSGQ